jgi:hypothetical protein
MHQVKPIRALPAESTSTEPLLSIEPQSNTQSQPNTPSQRSIEPLSLDVSLRLYHLEGSAQAALATLRRSLVEKVPPTRNGLAHEAAIAFDLEDHQQALAIVDRIAQTVGISAL